MPDPEITIRRATAADSATLSRVDASAPIVEGSKSIAIDRAPDYISHRRIMGPSADGADGEPTILVAEVDGEIAGVYCGIIHTAPIDGRARRLRFLFGARILPQYQGLGIGRTLAGALRQAYQDDLGESMYYFIVRGNEAAESAVRGIGERWTVEAAWAHIHTDTQTPATALTDFARQATPADAQAISDILNAGHQGEQLFSPYTPDRLSDRLSRVDVYGWDALWRTDGAALGIWTHWNTMRETEGDTAIEHRTAMALDFGALPGHEEELTQLLRGASALLHEQGVSRLGLFTSQPARLYPLIEPLVGSWEHLGLWTPQIAEPEASRYGVYLDPVYF